MAASLSSNCETLVSLSVAFSNFRQSSGLKRPVFPPALKRRALAFLEQGVKREDVGNACGVSKHTIALWKTQIPPSPRRLVVVPEKESEVQKEVSESVQTPECAPHLSSVSFHLKSGISFDLSREDAVWLVSKLSEVK